MATSAQTGVSANAIMPVAVVLNQVKDWLDSAWTSARQFHPQVFPTTLPARVLIKPNLCDIVAWENGVTTDPSWLHALVPQLRAIRPDVQLFNLVRAIRGQAPLIVDRNDGMAAVDVVCRVYGSVGAPSRQSVAVS